MLIVFIWNLTSAPDQVVTFALSYQEAVNVAAEMGYTLSPSWATGSYTTTKPSARLRE